MRMMIGIKARSAERCGLRMRFLQFNQGFKLTALHRFEKGGPTLNWFDIQPELKESVSDVLLLLDCCFAGQAARSRVEQSGGVELLAASAMGVKTLVPGPRSFTRSLIKELKECLEKDGFTTVSKLQMRLSKREANLYAQPIHIKLEHGLVDRSIKLEPYMDTFPAASVSTKAQASSSLSLVVSMVKPLDAAHIGEIFAWLKSDIPRTIDSIEVDSVRQATQEIRGFVEDFKSSTRSVAHVLDEPAQEDIIDAWDNLSAMLKQYEIYHKRKSGEVESGSLAPLIHERARKLLIELAHWKSVFIDKVEQNVLYSPELDGEEALDSAINNPSFKAFGLADKLALRRIARREKMPWDLHIRSISELSEDDSRLALYEYKAYPPSQDPVDVDESLRRVGHLVDLLTARKSCEFLSLPCSGAYHDPSARRFVLLFDIPSKYQNASNDSTTLLQIIRTSQGSSRPTLNQRFWLAFLLARAVEKWHSVDWLHQGINSRNIIFFRTGRGQTPDFSSPYLLGLDFARPNGAPSIGRYVDDIGLNLYRHPKRQGTSRDGHKKMHDIYGLGVVLLEIGLWQSAQDIVLGRDRKEVTVDEMVQKLQSAVSHRLAHYAGVMYRDAVNACLLGECEQEFDDRSQSNLARAFRAKVIEKLDPALGL